VCKPYAAEKLVKALRDEVGLPVHFHTHDTSGINAASILKAAEAGVDVADGAIASMSGTTSQPNLNSVVAALANTPRDTGLDLASLDEADNYWEIVRTRYAPFDSAPKSGTAQVYLHEMPGGQYTNLREQAEAMGLGARWPEVARMYADVNMAFGDIVKVTPSSKVVGDLAIFLISHEMTIGEFKALGPHHGLTLPNSVVDMFSGSLGVPDGGWPKDVQEVVLKGGSPKPGRPGEHLPAVDLAAAQQDLSNQIGQDASWTDLMNYLMYPEVFLSFQKSRETFGDVRVLPTVEFFYGMEPGSEVTIEIEPGKVLIVKFLTISDAHPDGTRTVFFELNGQPREVSIIDRSIKVEVAQRAKAEPGNPGHVGAPIPGAVTSITVGRGEPVKKGDRLLVMEAMKMQTTVYAPTEGKVQELLVQIGDTVEAKDLLAVIAH
jgi:pyruvate carboxylase